MRHPIYVARDYVASIRNKAKRAYAVAYLAYRRGAALEPDSGELSYMAAQAVRLRINEIFPEADAAAKP